MLINEFDDNQRKDASLTLTAAVAWKQVHSKELEGNFSGFLISLKIIAGWINL